MEVLISGSLVANQSRSSQHQTHHMDHPLKVRGRAAGCEIIASKCSPKYPSPLDAWQVCAHLGFESQISDWPFFSMTHRVYTEDRDHAEVLNRPEK